MVIKTSNTIQTMFPIEENTLYVLFRRGESEHIKNLFEKGEMYIHTIDYIRTCDTNKDRSDLNDSMHERQVLRDVKIEMCDMGQDVNNDGITLKSDSCVLNYDNNKKGNIYCLSGIYTNDLMDAKDITTFDTKSFGESLIVILMPRQFIERVMTALSEAGYKGTQYKRVDYYNNGYSGQTGIFKKHENYSQQNEFRFYVPNAKNKPIKINIGSIEDIAVLNKGIYLRYKFSDDRKKAFLI